MSMTTTTSRTATPQRARRATATPATGRRATTPRRGPTTGAAAGRPIRSALIRVPLVLALIVILGIGVAGVLYLNTKIDESGIRTEAARSESADLRLEIEALRRSIAELSATPRIAQEAKDLGLVPVKDAATLVIDGKGKVRVVGSPATAGHAGGH